MRKLGGIVCDHCRLFIAYGSPGIERIHVSTRREGLPHDLIHMRTIEEEYCSKECMDKATQDRKDKP